MINIVFLFINHKHEPQHTRITEADAKHYHKLQQLITRRIKDMKAKTQTGKKT